MEKITITQVKSCIDRPEKQKRNIQALGLGKVNSSVTLENTPQIAGMVKQVEHLVTIEKA